MGAIRMHQAQKESRAGLRYRWALPVLLALGASAATTAAAQETLSPPAKRWWSDITALADDSNEGRLTGSKGYLRAANYVISRFKAEGLKPAGMNGYLQPVSFQQQTIDQAGSH